MGLYLGLNPGINPRLGSDIMGRMGAQPRLELRRSLTTEDRKPREG